METIVVGVDGYPDQAEAIGEEAVRRARELRPDVTIEGWPFRVTRVTFCPGGTQRPAPRRGQEGDRGVGWSLAGRGERARGRPRAVSCRHRDAS